MHPIQKGLHSGFQQNRPRDAHLRKGNILLRMTMVIILMKMVIVFMIMMVVVAELIVIEVVMRTKMMSMTMMTPSSYISGPGMFKHIY